WLKKPNKPPTPHHAWNDGKSIDSRPPQKWSSNIAKARQPHRTFDKYVMNHLKIDNLTQEILDDVVVLEDDKEEDSEVDDTNKDVKEVMVDESAQDQGRQAKSQAKIYKIDMDHANKVLSIQEDETEPAKVQEVVDVVTTAKLITEEPKPLKKKQQIKQDEQYARKLHAELNKDIDWDEAIDHVKKNAKEDHAVKKYQAMKRKPQTKAQSKKNMMMYLKNAKEDPAVKKYQAMKRKPQTEAQARKNMMKYLKNTKEQIEEDENRVLQKLNETPAERAAKRRKLDEEVEDLKRHL
nr:hypothetical protein [Tanacetum cinerariifolium]